jgi:hypothetical protein
VPAGVLVRPLSPVRTLPFTLLWRDETPSPALSEFILITSESSDRPPAKRPALVAVA